MFLIQVFLSSEVCSTLFTPRFTDFFLFAGSDSDHPPSSFFFFFLLLLSSSSFFFFFLLLFLFSFFYLSSSSPLSYLFLSSSSLSLFLFSPISRSRSVRLVLEQITILFLIWLCYLQSNHQCIKVSK